LDPKPAIGFFKMTGRPGVMLPGGVTMREAAQLAAEAEAAGADAVWVLDVRRDPYLVSAAALGATSSIEVGTDVAVAFSRSPAVTAQCAWDLAGWSGGRFILGLGSQVGPTLMDRFGVEADRPAPRLADYVRAVRGCWDAYRAGRGRYMGEYYRIRMPLFQPGADEGWPQPSIYTAGVNPVMTAVAGEVADGFAAHMYCTVPYLEEVLRPALAAGAEKAGRTPPPVLMGITLGRDRPSLARQMGVYTVPSYRRVLDHAGLADLADEALRLIAERRRPEAEKLLDENVLDRLGAGLIDDLPAVVDRWSPHAERLALGVVWYGVEHDAQVAAFRDVLRAVERL
jgi:probable F420-dependent oxidoreductase